MVYFLPEKDGQMKERSEMLMSELLTNFKDDILAESMEGRRRYQMITNEDGTVSFVDVTEYEQIGSEFGQAEVNAIHREINRKFDSGDVVDPLAAEEAGFAADAKLTGDALREVSANLPKWGTQQTVKLPYSPTSDGILTIIGQFTGTGHLYISDSNGFCISVFSLNGGYSSASCPAHAGDTYSISTSTAVKAITAIFTPFSTT